MPFEASVAENVQVPRAVELGRERSPKNLEYMRRGYIDWAKYHKHPDTSEAEIAAELEKRANEIEPDLRLSYRRQLSDALVVLNEGRIRSLSELAPDQQEQRRKSDRPLEAIVSEREQIEGALGWTRGDPVYHFLVDTDDRAKRQQAPGHDYGGVRLVFDVADFKDQATFTIGDSLNPREVPAQLVSETRDKAQSVVERQISGEALALAEALLESKAVDEGRFEGHLKYVEAQVCIPDQSELMSKLKRVVVYEQHATTDKRPLGPNGKEEPFESSVSKIRSLCLAIGVPFELMLIPSENFVVEQAGMTLADIAAQVLRQRGKPSDPFATYGVVREIEQFNEGLSSDVELELGMTVRIPTREDLSKP